MWWYRGIIYSVFYYSIRKTKPLEFLALIQLDHPVEMWGWGSRRKGTPVNNVWDSLRRRKLWHFPWRFGSTFATLAAVCVLWELESWTDVKVQKLIQTLLDNARVYRETNCPRLNNCECLFLNKQVRLMKVEFQGIHFCCLLFTFAHL